MRKNRKNRKPHPPINSARANMMFSRRATVIGGLQMGIGVLLAARMSYIAIAENDRYKLLSESNRVNLTLIPPRRGWIVDRYGKPIADNRTDFRVDIIPDRTDNPDKTVATLAELLSLDREEVARIKEELKKSGGFQPVQVATGLDWDRYAAISVRLPDLPGVSPREGFTRNYPIGAAAGHLIGYVGIANAEEYQEKKDPILITPGYKIGKDGLEKRFEDELQGVPGAKRVEVTAGGRIVRDLEARPDIPGAPLQLTLDRDLQHYAARRLGQESGSVVVLDCEKGDILCMTSMPSFNPNSFSDGIGRLEYAMLSEDDHVPLRDKSLKGLYPPGSTIKPMHSMAFLQAGVDSKETIICGGGRRIGNRFFRCWSNHGQVDMAKAIYQSCDSYYYHFAQQVGFEHVANFAKTLGMGQQFPLPVPSQFYGTVPSPSWYEKKYEREWRSSDTVNSSIGQGYYLASPLQLAVMSARLATGLKLMPRLLMNNSTPQAKSLGFKEEHITIVRNAMSEVVNGAGTARRAKLPLDHVQLAGKTGTAQVVSLKYSDGKSGPWKYRDHGLFVCFAPFDNPRYACAVVIEHGGGSGAAYPVARDVITFLYDRQKAMEALLPLEEAWGGTIEERMASQMANYRMAQGLPPEKGSQMPTAPASPEGDSDTGDGGPTT